MKLMGTEKKKKSQIFTFNKNVKRLTLAATIFFVSRVKEFLTLSTCWSKVKV